MEYELIYAGSDALVAQVRGKLDRDAGYDLKKLLKPEIRSKKNVIIDMTHAKYPAGDFLDVLHDLTEQANGMHKEMLLVSQCDLLSWRVNRADHYGVLTVYRTLDEALESQKLSPTYHDRPGTAQTPPKQLLLDGLVNAA